MKKYIVWIGTWVAVGGIGAGVFASQAPATRPPVPHVAPHVHARHNHVKHAHGSAVKPVATAVPTATAGTDSDQPMGWWLEVTGEQGIWVTCDWMVIQDGGSHTSSGRYEVPTTIGLGQGSVVSANCQKLDGYGETLTVSLAKEGLVAQTASTNVPYGIALVSSS